MKMDTGLPKSAPRLHEKFFDGFRGNFNMSI